MTKRIALFDLDDTLFAFAAACEAPWLKVCHEYPRGNRKASVLKIYETIREHNDRYCSDEKNYRDGRLAIEAARRQFVSVELN